MRDEVEVKTLIVLSLSALLLGSSPAPPGAAALAALAGTAGPGIESCAISGEGILSAKRTAPAGQGVRYIFYGDNGKWIGEQWTHDSKWGQADSGLLASQGSIKRAEIHAMRCTFLSPNDLVSCGPDFFVDEGSDIALLSLLFTRKTISVQFQIFYNNFFSRGDYQVRNQLYFIQLDSREPVEPVVTGTKAQALTLRFAEVKPGPHKLLYGFFNDDYTQSPRGTQSLVTGACFSTPAP